ncbi:hypothetical protein PGTUg99_034330 [Puccinia graminis f. sp. tritici]|uniref:Uncharacterized protein n=1 Tax=Puccinia graminis f. sp. tritici TaxID=56615 RepID=A0A5B0SGB3_PUCGR|nr:hypothetical protein PGTUg99_034330 [Puccinia graminis f. sp. tritici]
MTSQLQSKIPDCTPTVNTPLRFLKSQVSHSNGENSLNTRLSTRVFFFHNELCSPNPTPLIIIIIFTVASLHNRSLSSFQLGLFLQAAAAAAATMSPVQQAGKPGLVLMIYRAFLPAGCYQLLITLLAHRSTSTFPAGSTIS